ncbi:hypothetical protein ACYSNR_06915 [Enterococcus sp. LJL128]
MAMIYIGNKADFAIGFQLFEKEDGELYLFIKGKNVLSYERNGKQFSFRGDIQELRDWLEKKQTTFFDSTFIEWSVPLQGQSVSEKIAFIQKTDFVFQTDDQEIEMLEAFADWAYEHSWISASGGSFLPAINFYSSDGEWMELSWLDDSTYEEYDVRFLYPSGTAYINRKVFENVVAEFINRFDGEYRK